jgi:hypothetical protein
MAAAAIQSTVLLGVAVWGGTAAASRVQLHSPLLEALLHRDPIPSNLSTLVAAGAIGGLVGAALLLSLPSFTPQPLLAAQERTAFPLIVRLLYGGVTEEILIRWGLMSGTLWALWRVLQRGEGRPWTGLVSASVLISSVIFGVGHLPAAAALAGVLDAEIVIYIVTANALFGLVAGYLFWKHGLESAIVAHALAHACAFAFGR